MQQSRQQPAIGAMFIQFRANTPQLLIDIDRTKCKTPGIPLSAVFNTLQTNLGGYYVNDFNQFGRTWQVKLQAEAAFRMDTDKLKSMRVRGNSGKMIPLGTLAAVQEITGPRSSPATTW